jgi:hypothetical protein
MTRYSLLCIFIAISGFASAQLKHIKRSWVTVSVEDFTGREPLPDTAYIRYDFGSTTVAISFEPAYNFLEQSWSAKDRDAVAIGFDTWQIEHLSDTALTIYIKGFRRMKFLSEEYLSQQEEYLQPLGQYNGKPLYKANRYITPRYKESHGLREDIHKQDLGDDYNHRKAAIFLLSFIVTEKGEIEDVQILKGIIEGYAQNVVRELKKTSKHWRPATYKGAPVQTKFYYEVKFLDSLIQQQ